MIVILARAAARYEGRIDAELSLGDLCILIRDEERGGDGSVLVHDMGKGIPPRNWMPAGSVMETTPGGYCFTHEQRGERLEIFVETVYSEQSYTPQLGTQLLKLGAEREFSDLIARRLELVEQGLTLVAREWRTTAGPVDLLCIERNGRPVCLEVKRRRIDPNSVWQMKRYLYAIEKMEDYEKAPPARGIMVAPVLANAARDLLEITDDISFVRLGYHDVRL